MKKWHKIVSSVLFLVIVGYGFLYTTQNKTIVKNNPQPAIVLPSTCHSTGVLPDAHCTPGEINKAVTQDTIHSTICVKGYTKTIRPPVSYTEPLKIQQIKAYGYSHTNPMDFEEDHFIPLEVGGSPTDPHNLWPEPRYTAPNSFDKDKVENLCNEKVCTGQITLAEAQKEIMRDWTAACQ